MHEQVIFLFSFFFGYGLRTYNICGCFFFSFFFGGEAEWSLRVEKLTGVIPFQHGIRSRRGSMASSRNYITRRMIWPRSDRYVEPPVFQESSI